MSKDVFDYYDESDERRAKVRQTTLVWNILTVIVLIGALCLACGFLTVFLNPQSGLKSFTGPNILAQKRPSRSGLKVR